MMRAATTRIQRYASIGIFAVPLALCAFAGARFMEGRDQLRDLDALVLAQVQRIDAVEANRRVGQHEASSIDATGLVAPTLPLAGAQLKGRVSAILADAGAAVTGFEIVSSPNEAEQDRVAVRIAFAADITALQEALFELETARPRMRVPALDIVRTSDAGTDLSVGLEVESRWEREP